MAYEGIDEVEISTGTEFKTIPEGTYNVQVTNITKKIGKKYQSEEEEIVLLFEFTILDGDLAGEKLFRRVRPILSNQPKESNLWKVAKAILKTVDPKEFHVSDMKDAILKVVVEVTEKDGKQFNNIVSFMKK